jgi:phage gpG-like protein
MPDDIKIQILGLKEFRRELRAANAQLPRELRKVFNTAATAVVTDAKAKVPKRSGQLAGSIRARSTPTEGRVVMGSEKVPYAGFIEFGGRVGKGRKGKGTGSVSRPFIRTGRYLYPAFLRHQMEVLRAMENALRELQKKMES